MRNKVVRAPDKSVRNCAGAISPPALEPPTTPKQRPAPQRGQEVLYLSGVLDAYFRFYSQEPCCVKYSADVALVLGIEQPANDFLVNTEASGKVCARGDRR